MHVLTRLKINWNFPWFGTSLFASIFFAIAVTRGKKGISAAIAGAAALLEIMQNLHDLILSVDSCWFYLVGAVNLPVFGCTIILITFEQSRETLVSIGESAK